MRYGLPFRLSFEIRHRLFLFFSTRTISLLQQPAHRLQQPRYPSAKPRGLEGGGALDAVSLLEPRRKARRRLSEKDRDAGEASFLIGYFEDYKKNYDKECQ